MTKTGKPTKFSILTCSDNKAQVGRPFAKSYSLLDNRNFLAIVEQITAVLDKLGLKWEISTSGSLMERERTFISLKIKGENDKVIIAGREFQAFLNCLNSIPSNAGCTVTFANNTFCVCCRNTFASVLHDKEGAKFHAAVKHTKSMKATLSDIPLLVESYFASNKKLFANLKAFSVFPVTLDQAEKYFAAFIGRGVKGELTDKEKLTTRSANIIETLKGLHVRGGGNKGETALDMFQAVTEYYTHSSAGGDNIQKQIQSSEAGDGLNSKQAFYSWLVAHTQDKAAWSGVCRVGDTLLLAWNKAKTDKASK
jgi:hypothetical protein